MDQTLADRLVENALINCANRFTGGDTKPVITAIRTGNAEICNCIRVNLTNQIAKKIGEIDKTVKAIYTYQAVDTSKYSDDSPGLNQRVNYTINLVVWVERKSAALDALVASLEKDIQESQEKQGNFVGNRYQFNLNLISIEDDDITNNRGFGSIVNNEYFRTRRIWNRVDTQVAQPSFDTDLSEEIEVNLPEYFDPQTIPINRLLDHAESIENLSGDTRSRLEPHLIELKVILIRRIISDQLAYIDIAKNWFRVSDLREILDHRIGYGKIGGKTAGILLASRIINDISSEEVKSSIVVPESYFIGSDLIYIFMSMNGLMHWNDQKYKSDKQIWDEYPEIQKDFQEGELPPEIIAELQSLLKRVGKRPLIVRSSSQLEDNFGTSFAGKYESHFCPNQGGIEQNLNELMSAIKRTYASTLNPEALLYRRSKGLQDYDERMAVLIQVVQGEAFNQYFFPQAAGVAFSKNLYRWSPQIRQEDGFVRLVWGLGTRAVQRTGDDYPRLVALSHPTLQPDDSVKAIRHYSQQFVDVIDLEENIIKTLPIHKVLTPQYPILRLLAQLENEGFFVTPRMRISENDIGKLAITYHELLRRTNFVSILRQILNILETNYQSSIDLEFTLSIPKPRVMNPKVMISLLQCRPQSYIISGEPVPPIDNIPEENVIFSTNYMVPSGYLSDIRYIIFVSPDEYFSLPNENRRYEVGKIISQLNTKVGEVCPKEKNSIICIGPGRWGSMNLDLGVFVTYADIDHAGALIELSGKGIGPAPEPSLGTHFFQDLMEAEIYPLAINLDKEEVTFDKEFFSNTPSSIDNFISGLGQQYKNCIKLIDIPKQFPGKHMELIMDNNAGIAVGFLAGIESNTIK